MDLERFDFFIIILFELRNYHYLHPQDSEKYITDLVGPILNCLADPELKVRYFASESLYNVVKVARGAIVPLFPGIFSALSRLVTDPDQSVKNGSELLDRLLKVSLHVLISDANLKSLSFY